LECGIGTATATGGRTLVTNPIAGIIARQLSTALATAALPGAPVRPEPADPENRRRPRGGRK
jgi:hypothetical protein